MKHWSCRGAIIVSHQSFIVKCQLMLLALQVAYLGLFGGVAVNDTTRRILCKLLTNQLAEQFNFMGHGTKHAFSELQLKDVVNGE
jgi:hypothetical protein